MVPTWTGKMGNSFQSENFEQTGKVGEFYPEHWKSEENLAKILEKRGNFSQLLFFL